MAPGASTSRSLLPVALAITVVLLANALSYLPFVADDSLISLRYAQRLLDGLGLTWADGPPVEGYSNLLWILLCAGLGALGVDLIAASRLLGVACTLATVAALLHAYRPTGDYPSRLPALGSGLAVAVSGTVATWAIGGMEQPLVAALLAWALVGCLPLVDEDSPTPARALRPGIALALLCLTRPDGALVAAAVGGGLLLSRGFSVSSVKLLFALGLPSVVAVGAQLGFRLSYYGDWVPNTAHVKLAWSGTRLRGGIHYVGRALFWNAPWLLGAGVLASAAWRVGEGARRRLRLLIVPLVTWALYVCLIGGDIFPSRRHIVPLLVVLAFICAEGLRRMTRDDTIDRRKLAVGTMICAGLLGAMQLADPENRRARTERWEWDGEAVGTLLRQAFGDQRPLLAADPAGCMAYFSRLPAVDMLGLNDRFLAGHPPPDFGSGWLGHELGNGEYVLDRHPDLVMFCIPPGEPVPCFRSGLEMVEDPRFAQHYRPMFVLAGEREPVRGLLYVRAEQGKLGITREEREVLVPGYLLASTPEAAAVLDRGVLAASVRDGGIAELSSLELPPGRWRARIEGAFPALSSGVRLSDSRQSLARGGDVLEFDLQEGQQRIDLLVLSPPGTRARIERVVFRR